ncbi:hypothetical protein M422DRAFT_783872 [Sphaerobolus stellatus SS14]|uniref:Ubiquitin-like protease family profile domain-containing protein n=1 Tax=Sphaerobolus stellatus (strain SS14) TaxID=990650 RepID=A0A0C9UPR6_SPHS4|nr:hypothetical protein M422DRAFT_783872 [Sphaerobolus stellatus SS14]
MMLREATKNGRIVVPKGRIAGGDLQPCSCGKKQRRLSYVAAYWAYIEHRTLFFCDCRPAAATLVRAGLFPCTPLQPSIAFDINLLELITYNMAYTAPNLHGWALSLEWFWKERGYILGTREVLRKRFSNAFHWFTYLQEQVAKEVQEIIHPGFTQTINPSVIAPPEPPPSLFSPCVQCPTGQTKSIEDIEPPSTSAGAVTSKSARVLKLNGGDTPTQIKQEPGLPTSSSSAENPTPIQEEAESPKPATMPSIFLQEACPACFGGSRPSLAKSKNDIIVCIDGNFTQKCLQGKYIDPPLQHPHTLFVAEDEVNAMEVYIEAIRKKAANPRGQSVRDMLRNILPDHVLDECEKSFTAAQEKTAKASGKYYADTGLMALVCRHDRLLWVVNMTTPGEQQHYAFALLDKLFQHIPMDWHVGLLYDIGCQLERSMAKHSIMPSVFNRLCFAVSVFHAFGHQWSCQLHYHLRKCIGYGLSDGEGCERFWSNIRKLIPPLRVTGRHRWRWVLDRQFRHFKQDNLHNLAAIMKRKYKACDKKAKLAEKTLKKAGIPEATLKTQWLLQVEAQTAKLQRQSKNAADKEIERILDLREEQGDLQAQLRTLLTDEKKELEDRLQRLQQRKSVKSESSKSDVTVAEDVNATQEALDIISKRIETAEKALGVPEDTDLKALKGNVFLRHRVNARALKQRIQAKIRSHKFERGRLERVYRHHVMQEKDHQHTKTLLKRTESTVATLVKKFNDTVALMEELKRRKQAPLDVDDEIWNDDGLLEEENGIVPEWLGNQAIRDAIPAYLDKQRVLEETERLDKEVKAVCTWLVNETKAIDEARQHTADDVPLHFQLDMRMLLLWNVSEHWRRTLDPDSIMDGVWLQVHHIDGSLPVIVTTARDTQAMDTEEIDTSDESEISQDDIEERQMILAEECEQVLMQTAEGDRDVEDEEYIDTEEDDDDEEVEGSLTGIPGLPKPFVWLPSPPRRSVHDNNAVIDLTEATLMDLTNSHVVDLTADNVPIDLTNNSVIDLTGLPPDTPQPTRVSRRNRSGIIGKGCGPYSCFTEDVDRIEDANDGLFEGRVISVVAQALLQDIESPRAQHLSSLVLHTTRELLSYPGDEDVEARVTRWLREQLNLINPVRRSDTLLVPAFVPGHWTLVAIHWEIQTVRFYDSLPDRAYAKRDERRVEEEVWAFLQLMEREAGGTFERGAWQWVSETRGQRQNNGFDCGTFILADMREYFMRGKPSDITQAQMVSWKRCIIETLRGLEGIRYYLMTRVDDADGEVVIVDE